MSRRPPAAWSIAAAGVGLVLVVTGSFLPWVTSGAVQRNSYELTGAAARVAFTGDDGPVATVLRGWPLLGPVFFLPLLALLLRLWRSAGIGDLVLGVLAAVLGAGTVVATRGRSAVGMTPVAWGPGTLAIGGMVLVIAGVGLCRQRRPDPAAARHPHSGAKTPAFGVGLSDDGSVSGGSLSEPGRDRRRTSPWDPGDPRVVPLEHRRNQ